MPLLYTTIPFSSPPPLDFSSAKKPEWPTTGIINSLRPSIKTSPSTKLPREESPRHLVTPSEGSSSSDPGGIQSTATTSDDLGGTVTQSTDTNSSLLSVITDRNYGSSKSGSDGGVISKSGGQSETESSPTVTPYTLR